MPGSAARTATEPALLRRFSGGERALHWLLASTFLAMLASGLVLYLPSLAAVAADRRLWKTLHLGAAVVFWMGLVLLLAADGPRLRATARELDRFDEDDRRWLAWAATRRGPEPPQGRFNAGQKLNAAVSFALLVVLSASGLVMYLAETNRHFRGTSAILVHDLATWVAVPLVAGHLYLAAVHPSTRHSLRGMLTGRVRRDWARRHHPKWPRGRAGSASPRARRRSRRDRRRGEARGGRGRRCRSGCRRARSRPP
jgi:formate dehydrogenase subunit gamma